MSRARPSEPLAPDAQVKFPKVASVISPYFTQGSPILFRNCELGTLPRSLRWRSHGVAKPIAKSPTSSEDRCTAYAAFVLETSFVVGWAIGTGGKETAEGVYHD